MSTPLAHFFPRGILRDLAAAADADDDPVRFEWLCLEDSNPGDVNAPPQVAAGALVFVRGDENAKALAAWAEKSRLLTPRVVSTVKTTAIDLRRELAALLKAAADKADEWRIAAHAEWAPLAPDYYAGNGEVAAAIEGTYIEHRLAMHIGNDIRRMFDQLDPDIPTLRTDSPKPPHLSQEEAEDIARAGIEAYKDAEANCGRIIALTEEGLGAAAIAGQQALEAREPGGWSVRAAVVDEWRRATFVVRRRRPGDAP